MGYVKVSNIGKAYKRYPSKWMRLAEWTTGQQLHTKHWVLRDVSFTVNSGDAVGIIGVNGAGKSTLLKIITGTTQPTTGSLEIGGRIAALLELGMGFHPDFTGRQNVYMGGQILGISTEQISKLMPEIVEFSEIADYINQPLRTYSSGMQMRLAFSVATAVRPDILIIDEALSVGDSYFQHKCMQKIREFQKQGTTLLFVSHSDDAIRMLCQRAVMLDAGSILKIGDAATVMDYYRATQVRRMELSSTELPELMQCGALVSDRDSKIVLASKSRDIVNVNILSETNPIHSGDLISIHILLTCQAQYKDPHIGFGIRNKMGIMIYEANTYTLKYKTYPVSNGQKLSVIFRFPCRVAPGTYEIMVGVADGGYDRGSFERSIFFDQSFMIIEVVPGENTGWNGIYDLKPEVIIN